MATAGGNPGRFISAMRLVPVSAIDIRLVPGEWPLPPAMRAQVAVSWQGQLVRNPHLWDGRILGLSGRDGAALDVVDGVFRADAREDAYSAFMTWRQLGFAEIGIAHVFGWALIASNDGAVLFGRMGGETANAGKVYPPGGSLEPRDVLADGRVDVIGAIEAELAEETGLLTSDAQAGGMVAVLDGPRISFGRLYVFDSSAEQLRARIRRNLDAQAHRELDDVVIIRTKEDAERAGAVPYAVSVAAAFADGLLQ